MEKIYFFNSANFGFAEIDLRKKNLFFVGDNGSGKTTAIRAIHYYYNSDVKALGIDPNKRGFKDFYFQYENSFIIYQFSDYFVLVYKRNGEIRRIFSKQPFDLNRVVKNDEVVELKEVISYAKEAPLFYRPHTNGEFLRIIYGQDSRFLDFKLTSIRNYSTFVNLYNKIFNVNRAVFDTKSIKETIFTTLDRIEAGEIDYQEFVTELEEYRLYLNFYRAFKQELKTIDNLYRLKRELLQLGEELKRLEGEIAYRRKVEEEEKGRLEKGIEKIEKEWKIRKNQLEKFRRRLREIEGKIVTQIYTIKGEIEGLEKLKSRYTHSRLQRAEELIAQKEEIEKREVELRTRLEQLRGGVKGAIEEIEEEIGRLEREKRVLKEKLKEEEVRVRRHLEELFYEKLEKIKNEMGEREYLLREKIAEVEGEIEELEEKRKNYRRELEKLNSRFGQKREEIKGEIEREIGKLKGEIREKQRERENYLDAILKREKELKRVRREFEEEKERLEREYRKKVGKISEKMKFYTSILETKPNSFKEFLTQNVENWEEELYPVLDEKILSMDIELLKPRIKSETIFGIELDKSHLKSIPSMAEAEEELEKLRSRRHLLKGELEEKLEHLKKELQEKEITLLSQIEVAKEKGVKLKREVEILEERIGKLREKLQKKLEELNTLFKGEKGEIETSLRKIEKEIGKRREEIKKIFREIKNLQKEMEKARKKLEQEKKGELEKRIGLLRRKMEEEKKKLDKKIGELKSKRGEITRDQRIKELERELEQIKKLKGEIQQEEIFLKEWERVRGKIAQLPSLRQELEKWEGYLRRWKKFGEKLERRGESRLEKLEELKGELHRKLEIVKEGLARVSKLPHSAPPIPTERYLKELFSIYTGKKEEESLKKASFRNVASQLNSRLRRYPIEGVEVNFNLELLTNLVPAELEKVDELYLFKEKKFEILNRTRLKGLKNLVSGILEKKLESFESAKEDFLTQVRRINQNLEKVDFGIVGDIKIEVEESKRSILKLFRKIRRRVEDLIGLMDTQESLFFDSREGLKSLETIIRLFGEIKREVGEGSFSLVDVIEINVKFRENNRPTTLKIIKNESSTGGSILLKIAIAVSLLELFIKHNPATFFLILDEVSMLSTKNQKILKEYVNQRGLGVIYVTPDLPLVDVEEIDIYKFRNINGQFEVVKLINDPGIQIPPSYQ